MRVAFVVSAVLVVAMVGCEREQPNSPPASDADTTSIPAAEEPALTPHDHAAHAHPQAPNSVYDFTVLDIGEQPVDLAQHRGQVLLIVNVASRCGHTRQYTALQELHTRYQEQGFAVLGFPANNFGNQEPGSNLEIETFCTERFGVTFPMFAKLSVKGDDQHPLYAFLTSDQANPATAGDVPWNFTKFLVGPDGQVLARFNPGVQPTSEEVVGAIEAALGAR